MLERVDAMESELTALVESLRTGGNRLQSDLQLLETNLSEVGEAVTPRRTQFEPEEPEPAAVPEPAALRGGSLRAAAGRLRAGRDRRPVRA